MAEWGGLLSRCRILSYPGFESLSLRSFFIRDKTMRLELKRIEIWPVVKIVFLISLIIGFFISLLYAGFFMVMGSFMGAIGGEDITPMLPASGVMALLIIIFGTFGVATAYTIGAVIFVAIYNIFSKVTGGFIVNFEDIDKKK